jgi:transposase InsO family protein
VLPAPFLNPGLHAAVGLRDAIAAALAIFTLPVAAFEKWRRHYNTIRPHSSLGYRPPAPEAGPVGMFV